MRKRSSDNDCAASSVVGKLVTGRGTATVNSALIANESVLTRDACSERPRIGELLVKAGLVTNEQVQAALRLQKEQGGKTVENLIRLGHLTLEAFRAFLGKECHYASIAVRNYEVPRAVISLISREFAVEHQVIPLDKMGNLLTVAMACPQDAATIECIQELTGLRVRALLCDASDLESVIKAYYGAEQQGEDGAAEETDENSIQRAEHGIKLGFVGALIKEIESLPPMPDTVQRVRAAIDDPDSTIRDVVNVVSTDTAIVAKLLSLANSAALGYGGRVTSAELAVKIIGLQETYHLVLSLAALRTFGKASGFDYEKFWDRAVFCGVASEVLARACGYVRTGEAFCAGLMSDIGRVALAQVAASRYATIDPNLCGEGLLAAERELFFLTHAEVGYILTATWNLPAQFVQAIRFHHNPSLASEFVTLVCLVALASHLLEQRGTDAENFEISQSARFAMESLKLDEPAIHSIRARIAGLMRGQS